MLILLRTLLRVLARLWPRLASRLAMEIFRTPRRYTTPARERELMADAKPFELALTARHRIRCWSWGSGPVVILAHGWEGRGSQMATFAAPLMRSGYRVITYDAPGHGASSGRQSSLPHFTWALRSLVERVGRPAGIIAHSFGCAITTLALRDGMEAERLVFIATPLDPGDYTRQFGEMFALPEPVFVDFRDRIVSHFGRPWSDYSLAGTAPRMRSPLLIIHDRDDPETRWIGGARLAELWPGARLMSTEGLGHRRILRDPGVVEAAVSFIRAGANMEEREAAPALASSR